MKRLTRHGWTTGVSISISWQLPFNLRRCQHFDVLQKKNELSHSNRQPLSIQVDQRRNPAPRELLHRCNRHGYSRTIRYSGFLPGC